MKYTINNKSIALGNLVDDYADVELHFEDTKKGEKVFSSMKANKVVLALYSPFFHRLFQSSRGLSVFHLCFVGAYNYNIVDVINFIYGHSISIQQKNVARFENLLKLLEIDYEKSSQSEGSSIVRSDSDSVCQPTGKKIKLASPQPVKTKSGVDNLSTSSTDTSMSMTRMQGENVKAGVEEKEAGPSGQEITREYIEKCFETTETGLAEELNKYDFKLGTRPSDHGHRDYTCRHCGLVLKALNLARDHFIAYHQNRDAEIKVLKECVEYSNRVTNDIAFLEETMKGNFNETMVLCQLENILNNLRERVDILKNLQEKNLVPHLKRKRDEFIEKFSKKRTTVQQLLARINK